MRKYGNRYSTGLTLTQREAETLVRCIKKIEKIADKEGRYIGEQYKLQAAADSLKTIIKNADRTEVL